MNIVEITETIKKHITIIKKTIIGPLGFDTIIAVPKKNKNDIDKEDENGKEIFRD